MRHFLQLASAITALTIGMANAALAAVLIAPTGGALRLAASLNSAPVKAIVLTAIAARADHDLTAAARAKKLTACEFHRQPIADETGPSSP